MRSFDRAREISALIGRGYDAVSDDAEYDELALALHRHQAEHCSVVRRLLEREARRWTDIPLVPVSLFAAHEVATFDTQSASACFESSGTTRATKGRHYFATLDYYRASALAGAGWALGGEKRQVVSLWKRTERSSLATMIAWMQEALHDDAASTTILIGAAFDYVNAIDAGAAFSLPPGSIVVETGGYKGQSREMPKDDLYAMISEHYRIPHERIISEYGMCELSSPMWERVGERGFRIPPWVRVRTLDPETMQDAAHGVIAVYDLANVGSSLGILTADTGHIRDGRLFLSGRLSHAPIKGCSTYPRTLVPPYPGTLY